MTTARNAAGVAELLPCPFCGKAPITGDCRDEDETGERYGYSYAECPEGHAVFHSDTPAEATTAWNTRAALPSGGDEWLEKAAVEAEKFAAGYEKAASEDDSGSENYRNRCREAGEVIRFIATAIRALKSTPRAEGEGNV